MTEADAPVPESSKEGVKDKPASETALKKFAELLAQKLPPGPIQPREFAETIFALTCEVRQEFSGPFPPPHMLEHYEKAKPGFTDIIIKRLEKEQDFRHEMGRAQVQLANRSISHRAAQGYVAQACAFVIAMTAIVGGVVLSVQGQSAVGIAAIVTALTGLVATFITAQIVNRHSREESGKDGSHQSGKLKQN